MPMHEDLDRRPSSGAIPELAEIAKILSDWAYHKRAKLNAVHLVQESQEKDLSVWIQQSGNQFDNEFEDLVSDLDIELANSFPEFYIEVHSIPAMIDLADYSAYLGKQIVFHQNLLSP